MPSLSSSIVNQQVASVRDVEEALSRQSLYGGDLITNLLELAAVSEERLSKVLAESHALEPAPVGELPVASERVRRLLPGDLAQRFALYPLEERGGSLVVAVAEPLPLETEQDLSFSLGAPLIQKVALLVRVQQAIARDYGAALDRRSLRVLARLSGKPDPSPSSLPSRAEARPIERKPPETVLPEAPHASPTAKAPVDPSFPSRLPSRLPGAPAVPDLARLVKPALQSPKRRLGPYTAAMAENGLEEAESRDDVLRVFFDFANQYFEYAALFAVHGDLAEGKDAAGAGASRSRIVGVGVPLDLPSAMSRARDSSTYELTRLGSGGLDGALAKDLERRPGRAVLFLPVQVRARTVFILYGDHGERDVELSEIGDVISFAPLVTSAFERLILRRRLRDKGGVPAPPREVPLPKSNARLAPRREPSQPMPSASERAATLATLIADRTQIHPRSSPPRSSPPRTGAPPPPSSVPPEEPAPTTPRVYPPAAPTVVQRMISIGPLAPLQDSDFELKRAPVSERSQPPPEDGWDIAGPGSGFSNADRGTRPGVGSAIQRITPVGPELPPSQRSGALPRLPLSAEPPPTPSPDAPEIQVTESTADIFDLDDFDAEGELAGSAAPGTALPAASGAGSTSEAPRKEELESDPEHGAPLAAASRALAYSARPPPPREVSQDEKLPSVIVDVARDTNELVRRLLRGDANAGDQLLKLGDAAITVLAGIFPGPITAELRRTSGDGPAKASECGPVLRTLARMGTRAVPFVSVRTADGDPNVRAWAARLLGELPCGESSLVVMRRLTDDDAEVRRAALAAGHMLLHNAEAAEALQARIAETVSDATRPEPNRHSLIEALAELRAPLVVPTLVRLLEDGSPDIVRSAHWALGVITRQDFGTKAAAWEEWWLANSHRHRVEWLIDALMNENQDVRRTAGDELKNLTKEYFGYYDDLPKKERERAQDRYRKWWDGKGKARFR